MEVRTWNWVRTWKLGENFELGEDQRDRLTGLDSMVRFASCGRQNPTHAHSIIEPDALVGLSPRVW
jgi:hypothetical protein